VNQLIERRPNFARRGGEIPVSTGHILKSSLSESVSNGSEISCTQVAPILCGVSGQIRKFWAFTFVEWVRG